MRCRGVKGGGIAEIETRSFPSGGGGAGSHPNLLERPSPLAGGKATLHVMHKSSACAIIPNSFKYTSFKGTPLCQCERFLVAAIKRTT